MVAKHGAAVQEAAQSLLWHPNCHGRRCNKITPGEGMRSKSWEGGGITLEVLTADIFLQREVEGRG